ncbi:hypothetical protein KXD40_004721 [Peronospora effusa]|uniref:Uncharacterized protein n=1 Tax=Peronospora effusa TaxID=542832 RepID=A0A3M6VP71_9STRA|nr:hypothetical protein DD238_004956 [Peronospora effusa]RQM11516.1 hypothetical protein DD237_005505 [Peronospora effusa]UIZ28114.1 hypothetical protein KXD40_004721 [Peronospora effusa]CAI5721253.1 unnamed protein product [Peronospora effusa]
MSNPSVSSETDTDVGSKKSMSSSSSSSTDDDVSTKIPTIAPKRKALNDEDTCTWYANAICSRPRSCFDCLNVVIPGQDCAVSPRGECMNFYMASSIGGYPMDNFTYCSADDTICSVCRTNWINDYTADIHVSSTAKCVGQSGCICLASCELPNHQDAIVDIWCNPVLNDYLFQVVAGLLFGTIALFVVATILTKRQLARRLRQDVELREARSAARAALRETRRPSASAHLPRLSLSGWAGMREKLVSSEQSRLESGARSTQPALARSSTVPSTTDVEQGDGYRQMSPRENLS